MVLPRIIVILNSYFQPLISNARSNSPVFCQYMVYIIHWILTVTKAIRAGCRSAATCISVSFQHQCWLHFDSRLPWCWRCYFYHKMSLSQCYARTMTLAPINSSLFGLCTHTRTSTNRNILGDILNSKRQAKRQHKINGGVEGENIEHGSNALDGCIMLRETNLHNSKKNKIISYCAGCYCSTPKQKPGEPTIK